MISSQLGRVLLTGTTMSEDAMTVSPAHEGYGPSVLLEEIAAQIRAGEEAGDDRRPGRVC